MYRIGEFSKISKTTIKTLRYYDAEGLLQPETVDYQATIKELPEVIVYSTKATVKSFKDYFQLIPSIGEKLMKKYPDLKCATPEYCFIKYLDGEYREKDINIEFCEAVTVVSTLHKGSYATISKAYAYLMKWIEENGYAMLDAPRECRIDGIWNKETEEEWLTEVQIPLKK